MENEAELDPGKVNRSKITTAKPTTTTTKLRQVCLIILEFDGIMR